MIFLIAIQKEELFLKTCNILIFFSLAWNIFDRVELKKKIRLMKKSGLF